MFGADTVQGVRVLGEEVVDVAEGAAGCVVAGQEEDFGLVDGGGLEVGVDSAGGGLLGEVFFEGEVYDCTWCLGAFAGGLVGGKALFEFVAEIAVHTLCVVPEEEWAERVQPLEWIHFRSVQVPGDLRAKCRYEVVLGALGVEMRVSDSFS